MTQNILPAMASSQLKRVLFVGCQVYTTSYTKQLANSDIDYWTTDVNRAATIWGAKDHHIVCDITKIADICHPESFDAVLLNGVFGHGVDDENTMNRAVNAIARILRPGGVLLIGWNSHKSHPNPTQLEAVTMHFRRESILPLPLVKTFPDTDHVYDWFVKKISKPAMPPMNNVR